MNDIPPRFSQTPESNDPVAAHSNAITYTAAALFAAIIVALIAFAPNTTGTSQMAVNAPSDKGGAITDNPRMPKAPTPAQ